MSTTTSKCLLEHSVVYFPLSGPRRDLPAKERIGSKAYNLIRMAQCALPVPPGFVLTTDVCRSYLKNGQSALDGLDDVLRRALGDLGAQAGRHYGDDRRPLLVSVRSGAAVSMPGMMETILNIGLNRATLLGLVRMTGNPRLAADCRRRLVIQYGEVVAGIAPEVFAIRQTEFLQACGVEAVDELDTANHMKLAETLEETYATECGHRLPADPFEQARQAVKAVLQSWTSERAIAYRKLNGIPDDMGTAVTVQMMVFGNLGPRSGAGVGFTRNPANGANELYVDYTANAQGEDVVAGRRIAMDLTELRKRAPEAYEELIAARGILEREFGDMQDFEFTVEDGRLLMLQARSGKRTPLAALRIAHDLVAEGLISPEMALDRLKDIDLDAVAEMRFAHDPDQSPLMRGTAAGAGVAVGAAVFDPNRVTEMRAKGQPVILLRENAETADIEALSQAAGLISAQGARTSHAAVVARQLGKPCIVGCANLVIEANYRSATTGNERISEGDILSIDGGNGEIYRGALSIVEDRPAALLDAVAAWREAK